MSDVRKNQNEAVAKAAEAARAGARQAVKETGDAVRTGFEGARRLNEEFSQAFGPSGQNQELTRQATQNLQVMAATGSALVRGFQELSKEWLEVTRERLQKNTEGLARLAECRNFQDLATVQGELLRDNVHEMIAHTRRIAERSVQLADDAARTIAAEADKAADRLPRAA